MLLPRIVSPSSFQYSPFRFSYLHGDNPFQDHVLICDGAAESSSYSVASGGASSKYRPAISKWFASYRPQFVALADICIQAGTHSGVLLPGRLNFEAALDNWPHYFPS